MEDPEFDEEERQAHREAERIMAEYTKQNNPPPYVTSAGMPFAVQQAANTINAMMKDTDADLNLNAVMEDLNAVFRSADEYRVASILAVQSHVLDALFNKLLTRPDQKYDSGVQIAMALRAQRQCLDTLGALTLASHRMRGA